MSEAVVRPMSMGAECEYLVQGASSDDLRRLVSFDTMCEAGINSVDRFVGKSGGSGRIHVDCNHVEFCTAEVLGSASLACADQDGIAIVEHVAAVSGVAHKGIYRNAGVYTPEGESSRGYHENYLTDGETAMGPRLRCVLPSHTVSNLMAMTGTVRGDQFVLAQKIWHMGGNPVEYGTGQRRTTKGDKPMIMIRNGYGNDITGIDGDLKGRIEKRNAEPGHSIVARYLNFAATSLMIEIIKNKKLFPDNVLQTASFKNVQTAGRAFASDLTLTTSAETLSETKCTALGAQEIYIGWYERLVNECGDTLAQDDIEAVPLIRELYESLSTCNPAELQYTDLVMRTIDFAPRHKYLARFAGDQGITMDNPEIVARNLLWDRVVPEAMGQQYFRRVAENDPRVARIRELYAQFGRTGRAALRASLIDNVTGQPNSASWATLGYGLTEYKLGTHDTKLIVKAS